MENPKYAEIPLDHFPHPPPLPSLEDLRIVSQGYCMGRSGSPLLCLRHFSRSLQSLTMSIEPLNIYAGGYDYGVPGDCIALVHDMIKQPQSFPFFTSLTLPYRANTAVKDLGQLLRLHGPMNDCRGLTVRATLVSYHRDEAAYDGSLKEGGEIGERFILEGVVFIQAAPTASIKYADSEVKYAKEDLVACFKGTAPEVFLLGQISVT